MGQFLFWEHFLDIKDNEAQFWFVTLGKEI